MSDNQTLIKNATNATTETPIFGCPKYFYCFFPFKTPICTTFVIFITANAVFFVYFSYLCGI